MRNKILNIGIDVGSTTVKMVVMNNKKEILYSEYRRHFSDTKKTINHDNFPLSNIHNHQLEHMRRIISHKGITFLIRHPYWFSLFFKRKSTYFHKCDFSSSSKNFLFPMPPA